MALVQLAKGIAEGDIRMTLADLHKLFRLEAFLGDEPESRHKVVVSEAARQERQGAARSGAAGGGCSQGLGAMPGQTVVRLTGLDMRSLLDTDHEASRLIHGRSGELRGA